MRVAQPLSGFVVALLAALAVHVCTAGPIAYAAHDESASTTLAIQGTVDASAFAVGFLLGWAGLLRDRRL